MATAKFDAFEIPKVYVLNVERTERVDNMRMLDDTERRDVIGRAKRVWRVEARFVPLAALNALENYLDGIYWGYGDWWTSDMGAETNTVRARIDATSWRRNRMLGFPNHRNIAFNVIEQ